MREAGYRARCAMPASASTRPRGRGCTTPTRSGSSGVRCCSSPTGPRRSSPPTTARRSGSSKWRGSWDWTCGRSVGHRLRRHPRGLPHGASAQHGAPAHPAPRRRSRADAGHDARRGAPEATHLVLPTRLIPRATTAPRAERADAGGQPASGSGRGGR
jgi:hypothetical protein